MGHYEILETLCAAGGPSGFEANVVSTAAELMRPVVSEVSVDRLGNVIGVCRCGKRNAKRL